MLRGDWDIEKFGSVWKAVTVIISVFVVTASFASALTDQSDDSQDAGGQTASKVVLDLSIKDKKAGSFAYSAKGPSFEARFPESSNDTYACMLLTEDGNFSIYLNDLMTGKDTRIDRNDAEAKVSGTELGFEDIIDDKLDMELQMALDGIKETIVIKEPLNLTSDLRLRMTVDIENIEQTVWANDEKVGYQPVYTYEAVEVRDEDNRTVLIIPPAFAYDARNGDEASPPYIDEFSVANGTSACLYDVSFVPGTISLDVIVPRKLLEAKTTEYPVYVDPTLAPVISTYTSYSNTDVYVASNVNIMGTGTLFLDNCNLLFKNGPRTLKVYDNGLLELNATDVFPENAGQTYSLTINGRLTMHNSTVTDASQGIDITTNDRVVIEDSIVDKAKNNGIRVASTSGQVYVNWTSVTNSSKAGINVTSSTGIISILGSDLEDGTHGLWIQSSGATLHDCAFYSNTQVGARVNSCTSPVSFEECTIEDNPTGIYATSSTIIATNCGFVGGSISLRASQSTVTLAGCELSPDDEAVNTTGTVLLMDGCDFTDSGKGIISSGDSVTITDCTFTGLTAVGDIQQPTQLHIEQTTIINCTLPLSIVSANQGSIEGLEAVNNQDPLVIHDSTITMTDSMFTSSAGCGLWAEGSTMTVEDTTFEDNLVGARWDDMQGLSTFRDCTFSGNDVGANMSWGEYLFDRVDFLGTLTSAIDADNATVEICSYRFPLWKYRRQNTQTNCTKDLDLLVVGENGSPKTQVLLSINDSDGDIALDGNGDPYQDISIDDQGEYNELRLFFFREWSNGTRDFKTPHSLALSSGGRTSTARVVMDEFKDVRLVWNDTVSDFDDDGVPDEATGLNITLCEPREDVIWIEAENHRCQQSSYVVGEILAFGNTSLNGTVLLDPDTFTELEAGTYQILIRARGENASSSLAVAAQDEDGVGLLPPQTFLLRTEVYEWYVSDPFEITTGGPVRVFANDTSQQGGSALLDKLCFVRIEDGDGNPTGLSFGRITDPLEADSDDDLANDSVERSPSSLWFEVEQLEDGPRHQDANASSAIAVSHPTGSDVVVDVNLTIADIVQPTQDLIQLYMKARKNVTSDASVLISVTYGTITSNVTCELTGIFDWYNSTVITLNASIPTLRLRVYDLSDPDLDDSEDYVLLDKLHIRDPDTDPEPTFYASNPLGYDTDSDGLSDGYEIHGFFKRDRIEVGPGVELGPCCYIEDGKVYLVYEESGDVGFFHIDIEVPEDGYYALDVKWGIETVYGSKNLVNATELLNVSAENETNPQDPVFVPWTDEQHTGRGATELLPDGLGNLYEALAVGRTFYYEMGSGDYELNVSYDISKAGVMIGQKFRLWVDYILLLRKTLNPLDSDADDDGAWDGLEFEGNSFPLNIDTDDDTIWDGEEYFAGDDGWVTSPIRNDTDADGIRDDKEIDGTLGLDPTDMDTDGDELPDGWIDGWFYYIPEMEYRVLDHPWTDGLRQPWEGEDLDCDGVWDDGGYYYYDDETGESLGNETNPSDEDTDGDALSDGWELKFRGQTRDSLPCMLNPLSSVNATQDYEGDGLTNSQEHNFDTNPFLNDTDWDGIEDGLEVRVWLRTNISEGMSSTNQYATASQNDWIVYDPNPYDDGVGQNESVVYRYDHNHTSLVVQDRELDTGLEVGDPTLTLTGNVVFSSNANAGLSNLSLDEGDMWAQEGVYPAKGNNTLKFAGNDTSSSSDSKISLKVFTFSPVFEIAANTHLSFWMLVKASPGSTGHVGIDGRTEVGYLSVPSNGIVGLWNETLNVTGRNLTHDIWFYFEYNLSAVAGEHLSFLCVVYNDQNVSELGAFTAFFDDIRVFSDLTAPYDQSSDGTRHLHAMSDGSAVIYNETFDRIYILGNETEVTDVDDDGALEGPVYVFTRWTSPPGGIEKSNITNVAYKLREAYGPVDPFMNDSDEDGIEDGLDGPRPWGGTPDWTADVDGDGLVCAADTDSDNDTILDAVEDLDRDGVFEPADNETAPYWHDTDNDTVADAEDMFPLDMDNDGLTGFLPHCGGMYHFVEDSHEESYGSCIYLDDTDGDGLLDGEEDANLDGVYDTINETCAYDLDTDDDGLWDGYNNLSTTSGEHLKIEAESIYSSNRSCIIPNGTASDGYMVELWTDDYYEYQVTAVAGTPSGSQVKTGRYEIALRIQDNCTEDDIADYNPKNISLSLDGCLLHTSPYYTFDAPNGTWALMYLAMVNLTQAKTYTIRLESGWTNVTGDGEKFFLDYINLTRICYLGELRVGTDARTNDTDGDQVQDGTEWGLTYDTIYEVNQTSPTQLSTNRTNFRPDLNATTTTCPIEPDTDGDGLYDGWHDANGTGTRETNETGEDLDCDGLKDDAESDPLDRDTDDDALSDLIETIYGTNSTDHDTDGDGIPDATELGITSATDDDTNLDAGHFTADLDPVNKTNPLCNDTDGDSRPDGWIDFDDDNIKEQTEGEDFNCNGRLRNETGQYEKCGTFNETDPLSGDTDNDMINDSLEDGVVYDTNSTNNDTDGDSLIDGWEVYIYFTNPNCTDTDSDGLNDSLEISGGSNPLHEDSDHDGLFDGQEVDWDSDSDGDGAINAMDVDSDDDGRSDALEETDHASSSNHTFTPATDASNMTDCDTDGDEVNDTFDAYPKDFDNDGLTGYIDYVGQEVNGANYTRPDTDWDGLTDYEELNIYYTTVNVSDSDGDGLMDGAEVDGWYLYLLDEYWNISECRYVTSLPNDPDTDNDGMNDFLEFMVSDPTTNDTDGDHLLDPYDDDNSTVEMESPDIGNITLKVLIVKEDGFLFKKRHYYLWVSFNASDNAGLANVTVKFRDTGELVTAIDRDGDNTYQVNFTSSKDELADSFSVNVSVTDLNGNLAFRVEEGDFETGWEKLWETVSDWLTAALKYIREVAAAFLTMLVGPTIAGAILGLIEGFAKAMFDDLSFITQIPGMLSDLKALADGIWSMIKNPMGALTEMINQTIQRGAKAAPYPGTVSVAQVAGVVMRFFSFQWDEINASDLVLYCAAYTVLAVIGSIIWMAISGSVFSKIGTFVKGTQLATKAKNGFETVKNFAGRAKTAVTESKNVIGGTSKAAKEAQVLENGFPLGTAKVVTKGDEALEGAGQLSDDIAERVGKEAIGESDEITRGAAITASRYKDIADQLVNKKAIDQFTGAFKGEQLWDSETVLALDKIISNYAKNQEKFNDLLIISRKMDNVEGEIQKFIKSWGNSYGTGSKGLGGYEFQYEKFKDMVNSLDDGESISFSEFKKVTINSEDYLVDCDILKHADTPNPPDMFECKSTNYLTKPKDGSEAYFQIEKQAKLLEEGKVNSITWIVKGKISKPMRSHLEGRGITIVIEAP